MKIINRDGGGYHLEKKGSSITPTLEEALEFNQRIDTDCERDAKKPEKETEVRNKIVSWINGDDVGSSSQTLWSVMMGIDCCPTIPYDRWDFGRCYRLLQLVDKDTQKECLKEAAKKYPIWVSLEREWEKLTELYVKREEEEFKKLIKGLGW